jgi:tetratricopeptide (TPR) repeat protein
MRGLAANVRLIARLSALLVLLTATGYALHRWALLPMRCVHAASLGRAELESDIVGSDSDARRMAYRIHSELEGCESASPPDVNILVTRGAAAELYGDRKAAIADYSSALLINRRPEIYLRLGLVLLDNLNQAEAITNLTRACAFDPSMLEEVPYEEVRSEIRRRLLATYPADWIRQPG